MTPSEPEYDVPPVLFAQGRGARLAYQDFGDGPATIVAVPPMAQNIEAAWEWPALREMFGQFGSFSRWIQFDKRGTGASDRRSRVPGLDERVDDLRAVMDAAGVERSYIYGASEGGPMALLFAVTYPERVEGLILHGSGAYTIDPNLTDDDIAEARERHGFAADLWGTADSLIPPHFAPSLAGDPEFRAWHERYERISADRDSLIELLEISLDVDVTDVLSDVAVPTLLLHAANERVVPVQAAREAAAGIADARLFEYDSQDHFAYADTTLWMDELERFVTGTVAEKSTTPTGDNTASPVVEIKTLGRFAVTVDGSEVPTSEWGSKRARQLCKRLVAARGWPVAREQLYDQLWPDETDNRRLSARLSVQLSTVRRMLRGGVVANRETVALDLSEVGTDLEALFEADDGHRAAAIYGGDFLPDDPDEPWAESVRAAAREEFASTLRRDAERHQAAGELSEAASLLRTVVALDRYDDLAHQLLVDTLLEAGDISGARSAHHHRVDAMAELDIDVPGFNQ